MERNTAYYVKQIAARYPDLPPAEISRICLTLMRRIYGSAVKNHDIRINSMVHELSLKIYTPYYSSREANEAAQAQFNRRWLRRRFLNFDYASASLQKNQLPQV